MKKLNNVRTYQNVNQQNEIRLKYNITKNEFFSKYKPWLKCSLLFKYLS